MDGSLALASFSLPPPAELTAEAALRAGGGTISRVVETMRSVEEPAVKRAKAGFSRLAASSGSREAWMSILTRLAARSSAGLEATTCIKEEEEEEEEEQREKEEGERAGRPERLSNGIREVLYNYVMEDFRRHMDVAVSWLCEEWYNDKMQGRAAGRAQPRHYERCALRLLEGFVGYLHPQDKVLTRFLSEIPELNAAILSRVKRMCRDPSVTQLALTSLLYLVMTRPPVKETALDTVQDIWTEFEDARPMAAKYLAKYRPAFLEAAAAAVESKPESKPEGDGIGAAAAGTAMAA
ncbi:hypothetical protein CDD83_7858 [Cordyceps sp. RAO-2017]|nr:hypothetical protein CDD83_7858 [Cordyceps sp. RAO-2017]